jgi:hypothetical protein
LNGCDVFNALMDGRRGIGATDNLKRNSRDCGIQIVRIV